MVEKFLVFSGERERGCQNTMFIEL